MKKIDGKKIEKYKPVSTLNEISKIHERFIRNSFSSYAENILSNFILANRKSYSSKHVLLRLIENCKKSLDNKNLVRTVFLIIYLLQNFKHVVCQ